MWNGNCRRWRIERIDFPGFQFPAQYQLAQPKSDRLLGVRTARPIGFDKFAGTGVSFATRILWRDKETSVDPRQFSGDTKWPSCSASGSAKQAQARTSRYYQFGICPLQLNFGCERRQAAGNACSTGGNLATFPWRQQPPAIRLFYRARTGFD